MLQDDEKLNLEINSCIKNMPSKKKSSIQCEFSDEGCLSSGGLKIHAITKHLSSKARETSSSNCLGSDLVHIAEMKLEQLILKGFFEKCVANWFKNNATLMLRCVKYQTRQGVL